MASIAPGATAAYSMRACITVLQTGQRASAQPGQLHVPTCHGSLWLTMAHHGSPRLISVSSALYDSRSVCAVPRYLSHPQRRLAGNAPAPDSASDFPVSYHHATYVTARATHATYARSRDPAVESGRRPALHA